MIGHNTIFVNDHIFVMLRYLANALFHDFSSGGQWYILRAIDNRPCEI